MKPEKQQQLAPARLDQPNQHLQKQTVLAFVQRTMAGFKQRKKLDVRRME
jgi:hypothetical protein